MSQRRRYPTRFTDADRDRLSLAVGVVLPVMVGLALVPVRDLVSNATVALALGLAVVVVGTTGRRVAAAVAAASAALAFDVFHTQPYGSFVITRAADIEAAVLLLVAGLVVGQVASRNRVLKIRADDTVGDLARLHAVAELVADGAPAMTVVPLVAKELTDLLCLRDCRFEERFADKPGPFVDRNGTLVWGQIEWGTDSMGLPDQEVTLVVQGQGRPLGRYVLSPSPGIRVTSQQLLVAVTMSDAVGAVLVNSY